MSEQGVLKHIIEVHYRETAWDHMEYEEEVKWTMSALPQGSTIEEWHDDYWHRNRIKNGILSKHSHEGLET
jgi:hypothetical protein